MDVLQEFSQELVILSSRLIGEKVLITDTAGVIIGCSDEERIGGVHEASLDVLRTRQSSAHDIDAASSLQGTFAGVTLPLEFEGAMVGTVGITGDPCRVAQYGQMIRAFVEMMLRFHSGHRQRVIRDQNSQELARDLLNLSGMEEQYARIRVQAEAIGCDLSLPRAAVMVRSELPVWDTAPGETAPMEQYVRQFFDSAQTLAAVLSPRQMLVLAALAGGQDADGYERLVDQCGTLHEGLVSLRFSGVVSIGCPAHGIDGLHKSCLEALAAARIALRMSPRPTVLAAESAALERMIAAIPDRDYGSAVSQAAKLIGEQRDARELERVICAWCENRFNISEAAKALFIHKNTMLYRLNRLRKLTGFDLHTFRGAMTLYLALGSLRYREEAFAAEKEEI